VTPIRAADLGKTGTISAPYFILPGCHKALAIIGGVGIVTACATPGIIAPGTVGPVALSRTIGIEQPSGYADVNSAAPSDHPSRP
jgi:2-methylaconitate cis-trans-isomerase PrpF